MYSCMAEYFYVLTAIKYDHLMHLQLSSLSGDVEILAFLTHIFKKHPLESMFDPGSQKSFLFHLHCLSLD